MDTYSNAVRNETEIIQALQNYTIPPLSSTNTSSPSYSELLKDLARPNRNNKVTEIIKMKIIPPFTKTHFETNPKFNKAAEECIEAILLAFTPQNRHKITITKSMTPSGDRRLHTLLVTAPIECQSEFEEMKINGLQLLNKTIFPCGDDFWKYIPSDYPRKVAVRFTQLPYLCDDETTKTLLDLPQEDIVEYSDIQHEIKRVNAGTFYTGKASLYLTINNKYAEEKLRNWSFKAYTGGAYNWQGIEFYAHIPSIHSCDICQQRNKQNIGHDAQWCRNFTVVPTRKEEIAVSKQQDDVTDDCRETITSVIAEGEVPRQEAITISDNAADAELEHPEIENNNSNRKELQEQPWHLVTTKKRGRETSKQESPHATPSKQNINETNIHQTVSSNVQNG